MNLRQAMNNIRPGAPTSHAGTARRAGARFGARGFTLLELVIVLAIVGVVSTMGILRYGRALARYRAEAACQRLIADLKAAQTEARASSTSRTVRFTPALSLYEIGSNAQIAANAPASSVVLSGDPYHAAMRVDGLPGRQLVFSGRGDGNAGAVVVLTVGTTEKSVIIEPNFGRAYVAGTE